LKTRSFAPVLFVLLAASGCDSCDPPETTVPPPKPSASTEVPPTPRTYVERRWVGRVAGGCEETPVATARGSFKVSPVFRPGANKLPDEMATLCAFEWTGAADPAQGDLAALTTARGTQLVADPPVVVSFASRDPAWPARAERLRKRFLVQLGLVDKNGARIVLPTPATFSPVFIGVPDSSPASVPPDAPDAIPLGNNPHGYNVAWTAKLLSCSDDSGTKCLGTPRTELALGLREPPTGSTLAFDKDGGSFGTRSALAGAILSLVNKQLDEEKAGKVKHMVLNLSVGWEELFECAPLTKGGKQSDSCPEGETPVMNEQSKAVLNALDYASCKGAAIIAAAGNDPGLTPTPTGPILPAAWEGRQAPSANYCKCRFGDATGLACDSIPREDPQDKRPLLHAVGAVTPTDVPIPVSRASSSPRLVAPGSLVVMFPGAAANPTEPRYPMSGTSMSAAAMSGAVAAVWAHRPELDASAVVQAIYDSGVLLGPDPGDEADFCLANPPGGPPTGSCDRIHRISLCDAMKSATPAGAKLQCPENKSRRPETPIPIVKIAKVKPTKFDFVNLMGVVYGQPIIPICPDCMLLRDISGSYVSTPESTVADTWFPANRALNLALSSTLRPFTAVRLYAPDGSRISTPTATAGPATITPAGLGFTRVDVKAPVAETTQVQTATLTYRVTYAGGGQAMVTEEVVVE
jgi:hypothetical protein